MGVAERILAPRLGYPVVSQAGGVQGMLIAVGVAVIAVAIVAGLSFESQMVDG